METQTPKSDYERLMNAIIPVALEMLEEYGEFYPYGGALDAAGEVIHIGAKGESDRPPSQELIELLLEAFHQGARTGDYRATALVIDVRTIPPGHQEKTDAIQVHLDHRDGYSVEVFFPYQLVEGQVQFGTTFATKGKDSIFRSLV